MALEALRADPVLSEPDRRAFDLLAAADALLVRSVGEWQDRKGYQARRDALMGQIKLKTAIAILQTERAKDRIAELDVELTISREDAARLDDQLETANEELVLLERLRTTEASEAEERKALFQQADVAKKQVATERQRLGDQLADQKKRAETLDGIRRAELALKVAETVDAPLYAKAKYLAATGMLQEAHKEFDAGHWTEAAARTALAQAEAEGGVVLARPQYERATQLISNRARDRALEEDATTLVGVKIRLDREADLQRLVLLLHGLFADKQSVLLPTGAKALDAIKDLLTKYPSYPLQVTGFTSDQGKAAELAALSLARANAIYWALVARGIDAKRMSVDGKGPLDPVADDATSAGKIENERVELAILYHSAS